MQDKPGTARKVREQVVRQLPACFVHSNHTRQRRAKSTPHLHMEGQEARAAEAAAATRMAVMVCAAGKRAGIGVGVRVTCVRMKRLLHCLHLLYAPSWLMLVVGTRR